MARGGVGATTDHTLPLSSSRVGALVKTRVTERMGALGELTADNTGPSRFAFVAGPLLPEEEAGGAKGVLGLLDSAATVAATGRSPRPAPCGEQACTRRAMVRSALPPRPPTPTAPSAGNSAAVFFVLRLGARRAPPTGPPYFSGGAAQAAETTRDASILLLLLGLDARRAGSRSAPVPNALTAPLTGRRFHALHEQEKDPCAITLASERQSSPAFRSTRVNARASREARPVGDAGGFSAVEASRLGGWLSPPPPSLRHFVRSILV
jgi:hypothetical protein